MPFPVVYRVQPLHPRALSGVRFHGERTGGDLSHITPPEHYDTEGRDAPMVMLGERVAFDVAQQEAKAAAMRVAAIEAGERKKAEAKANAIKRNAIVSQRAKGKGWKGQGVDR